MLLSEILEPIEEKRVSRRGDTEVAGLAYDSRAVGKDFAFFCIKGR
jgi:UDP-N-acetylmuramyl tripeptide synthase